MVRSQTAQLSTLVRSTCTYTFADQPDASLPTRWPLRKTTIKLPPTSSWTSGLHYHNSHTEYLQIVQGTARVSLSGHTFSADAATGVITIPKGAVHEWRRHPQSDAQVELVVEEWTEPNDGQKEIFFRNICGVLEDAVRVNEGRIWRLLPSDWALKIELWNVMGGHDNFPVTSAGLAGKVSGRLHMFMMQTLGYIFSLHPCYLEYTPTWLLHRRDI
jgi:mannose-6-phosphate isomerase-like protein (cupin superfamily)